MHSILRQDDRAVASTVATLLALLVILTFLSIAIVSTVPAQQSTAEWLTSQRDLDQFETLRSMAAGPMVPGASFSIPFKLGTAAVSPFATASSGSLAYAADATTGLTLSFAFVPSLLQASVTKVNQDVVLLMDNSGSMARNDPSNLRILGAQEYVGRLSPPDCVAIVAFNGQSYLTLTNVGGPAHHLNNLAMCGEPNYNLPQSDLATITDSDSTNIGRAIATGNSELINYGQTGKAWIEILLTDGQNECGGSSQPCGDPYTLQMAQAAKANNITIYTIGLSSSADASLLSQIASLTGGTYYPAPTASSIRWIYYEISMHYQSSVTCSSYAISEAYGGSLELQLNSNEYPAQTIEFAGGGIAITQSGGQSMHEGLPLTYSPIQGSEGTLTIPLLQITGSAFRNSGTGTQVVQAQVLGRQVVDQSLTRVDLATEAANVGNIAANVTYWANQGAATQSAAAVVNAPLYMGQNELTYAAANASSGAIDSAKFSVDRAVSDLAVAKQITAQQQSLGTMQAWLAKQTEDTLTLEQCRVGQWVNWYDGLTITINSPAAVAWGAWFNETFSKLGMNFSVGVAGKIAVATIHTLDRITTDQRVILLSSG